MKKGVLLLLAGVGFAGCSQGSEQNDEVMVMAAASLNDAMDELIETYEQEHDVAITVNYGSSGQLRQQITQGAPADLFLSASVSDMDEVEEQEGLEASTTLLENKLVLITAPEISTEVTDWDDLLTSDYQGMAIGETDTVPAGRYAKQTLDSLDFFNEIEDKLIYGKDVRQVLTYVETGNADVGIVYQTDALIAGDAIEIVAEAPTNSHDPIYYPIGQLSENDAASAFYHWLQEDAARTVFESYGFQAGS
ncbi:molybdate ABC transporter substrate-binding protein [Shouchella sp. JSM 1781072]|uniref:molybdate ABC transporter substrate-binding protein n=1 Tax=Shouchella sp. JSM 1781072 TaxID=3344581 RepID=UPI0035C268D8